jgi:FkbM family methyltransferase
MVVRRAVNAVTEPIMYRLGRALYMRARADVRNDMATNGELMIQRGVIATFKGSTEGKLVCFDVGANVGDWSAALLENCRAFEFHGLDLYAFEPVPLTYDALKRRLGNIESVHCEQLAISSSNGTGLMYVSEKLAGTNSFHRERSDDRSGEVTVETTTAAQFCFSRGIDVVHLFKSDAEGHDANVVSGALPLLKAGKIAVLQFEYNHRWVFARHYLKDVFDVAEGCGYRVGKVCRDCIHLYDKWHPEHERFFEANYVMLRADALAWFPISNYILDSHNALTAVAGS